MESILARVDQTFVHGRQVEDIRSKTCSQCSLLFNSAHIAILSCSFVCVPLLFSTHRSVLVTTSWSERSFVSTDTRPTTRSTRRLVRYVLHFLHKERPFFMLFFFL